MILYPKFQTGGPLVVPSKSDSRYQAYSDSLNLYLETKDFEKYYRNLPDTRADGFNTETGQTIFTRDVLEEQMDIGKSVINNLQSRSYFVRPGDDPVKGMIKPDRYIGYEGNDGSSTIIIDNALYKKPTQPVVAEGSKQWEHMKNQEVLKAAGLYEGKIDGLWGPKSQAAWDEYMYEPEEVEQSEKDEAVDSAWELIGGKPTEPEPPKKETKEAPKKPSAKKTYSTELVEDQVITGYDRNGNAIYKTRQTRKKLPTKLQYGGKAAPVPISDQFGKLVAHSSIRDNISRQKKFKSAINIKEDNAEERWGTFMNSVEAGNIHTPGEIENARKTYEDTNTSTATDLKQVNKVLKNLNLRLNK